MIGKFKSSKFWNCPSETEILQLYFEIANRESESWQRTSEMNERDESEGFYQENAVGYCSFH